MRFGLTVYCNAKSEPQDLEYAQSPSDPDPKLFPDWLIKMPTANSWAEETVGGV